MVPCTCESMKSARGNKLLFLVRALVMVQNSTTVPGTSVVLRMWDESIVDCVVSLDITISPWFTPKLSQTYFVGALFRTEYR